MLRPPNMRQYHSYGVGRRRNFPSPRIIPSRRQSVESVGIYSPAGSNCSFRASPTDSRQLGMQKTLLSLTHSEMVSSAFYEDFLSLDSVLFLDTCARNSHNTPFHARASQNHDQNPFPASKLSQSLHYRPDF
jgi:hypothetical protein